MPTKIKAQKEVRVPRVITKFTHQIDEFCALYYQGGLLREAVEAWLSNIPQGHILAAIAEFEQAMPDYIESLLSQGSKDDGCGGISDIMDPDETIFGANPNPIDIIRRKVALDKIDAEVLGPIYAP